MNNYIRRQVQNIAVILLTLIGVKNILAFFHWKSVDRIEHYYISVINPINLPFNRELSFAVGLLMIFLAYRLFRRIRIAWIIEVVALALSITFQVNRHHIFAIPIVIIEFIVLVILILSYKDFNRKSDKITIKWSLIMIAVSFLLLIISSSIGIYLNRKNFAGVHSIYDAIFSSIKILYLFDTSMILGSGKFSKLYTEGLVVLNWVCVFASTILLLKPLVYDRVASNHDLDKVRKIVLKYGQNPMSYLALEKDKKYFFSENGDGVCAYTEVNNVMVICGDMICNQINEFQFLSEIMAFAKQNGWEILFLNITEYFMKLYKLADFGIVKYGEDACFDLNKYSLAGNKVQKVRAAINHANKAGITVVEYKPKEKRDFNIEKQLDDISREWLENKAGDEMSFMVGGVGLDKPLDRRYFYAMNSEGVILGFVVFLPYLSGKGYLADVTRRRQGSPQGVLEKIIYDSFMVMKEEGVEWGNMGLSPLYNVADGEKVMLTEKLFAYIYETMNESYGFKTLHHSKQKFNPTEWQNRYLAFYPKPFSIQFAYAIVKSQNPKGLKDIIVSEVIKKKEKFFKKKELIEKDGK